MSGNKGMDYTPILHAAISVAVQVGVGLLFANWWVGAVVACVWWIAREHTQAEYRWISTWGEGRRANMPWWGGFDFTVWDFGSYLDMLAPVVACLLVFCLV